MCSLEGDSGACGRGGSHQERDHKFRDLEPSQTALLTNHVLHLLKPVLLNEIWRKQNNTNGLGQMQMELKKCLLNE